MILLNLSFSLHRVWYSTTEGIDGINYTFQISLCSEIPRNGATDNGCPAGTSVCLIYPNSTKHSAGNFSTESDELAGAHNEDLGESWLAFAGEQCPSDSSHNLTTVINFKCGFTMVSKLS